MAAVDTTGRHPGAEQVVDYYRSRLRPERAAEVEEHMAVCAPCAEQGRFIHTLLYQVEHWSAAEYGASYLRVVALEELERAETKERDPDWRQRLHRWRVLYRGFARGALELVVGSSGLHVAVGEVQSVVSAGGWRFTLVAALRGQESGGRAEHTVAQLEMASSAPPSTVSVTLRGSSPVVTLGGWSDEQLEPGILLIDLAQQSPPVRGLIQRSPDGSHEVVFPGVGQGRYGLLFAPVGKTPA